MMQARGKPRLSDRSARRGTARTPTLATGDVVVMDHLFSLKSVVVRNAIRKVSPHLISWSTQWTAFQANSRRERISSDAKAAPATCVGQTRASLYASPAYIASCSSDHSVQLEQRILPKCVAVVGLSVAAGDCEHPKAQHGRQRVNRPRRVAPLPDPAGQRIGQAEPAFGRRHHVPRDVPVAGD